MKVEVSPFKINQGRTFFHEITSDQISTVFGSKLSDPLILWKISIEIGLVPYESNIFVQY